MIRRHLLPATVGAWFAFAATAAFAQGNAVELSGVRYPPGFTLANTPLVLNGAGIRYRFVVKVYTAGLYLPAKADTPEAVLRMQGPKRLHVQMLRDIDGNDLGKLFTRGMQDNSSREEFGKSIPGTLRMAELFAAKKRLTAGENFTVEWVPNQGTQILLNGKASGEPIKEPEFFNALLRIWLGNSPADALLKDALLGLPPRPVQQ
jgi:hypothetical protein